MILAESGLAVEDLSNLVVIEKVKLDSTYDEKRVNSDEKASLYFMTMVEWFEKADLDFLRHLYNMEKTSYEKGVKDGSAFLGFLEDYLKRSGKI